MTTRSMLARVVAGSLMMAAAAAGPAGADGEVPFGGQWWDQNVAEAKYFEFRDLPNGGFIESFRLQETFGRNGFTLLGANALRDDQATRLSWMNGARWRVDLGHMRIPHIFSVTARTPYAQNEPGVYTMADAIQQRNQTTHDSLFVRTMTNVLANSPQIGLGFRTDVTKGRMRARPARGLQIDLTGSDRRRSGSKAMAVSFGQSNTIETLEPIDQRMLDGELRVDYQRDLLSLQAAGGVSVFENDVDALILDNPKRLTDTTTISSRGRLDLYPTNRAFRGSVALGLQLPRRSVLNATVGIGRHTQHDAWLPLTINSTIAQAQLAANQPPGTNTDAKATTLSQDYRLITRALTNVTGTLRFSQHKFDNETPEVVIPGYVRYDASWSANRFTSRAFGNDQWTAAAEVDVTPTSRLTIGGSAEHRKREHTHREIEEDTENTFGLRVRSRPTDAFTVEGRYRRGEREAEEFHLDEYRKAASPDSALVEQPNLRRYDLADRTRDEAGAGISWMLGERMEVGANYSFLLNDYDQTILGLQTERLHQVMATATIHATDRLDLSGGYGYGKLRTNQTSVESGASLSTSDTSRWTAEVDDKNVFYFAGADWTVSPKLTLSANYEFSRDQAHYDLEYPNPAKVVKARDLPETFYRRHTATTEARYFLGAGIDLMGRYTFDDFTVDDFASQNFDFVTQGAGSPDFPTVQTTAIYLGDAVRNFEAHRFAVLVRKTF